MNELAVHPNVYWTDRGKGLVSLLERVWIREHIAGEGTLYVISAFANYNGECDSSRFSAAMSSWAEE